MINCWKLRCPASSSPTHWGPNTRVGEMLGMASYFHQAAEQSMESKVQPRPHQVTCWVRNGSPVAPRECPESLLDTSDSTYPKLNTLCKLHLILGISITTLHPGAHDRTREPPPFASPHPGSPFCPVVPLSPPREVHVIYSPR